MTWFALEWMSPKFLVTAVALIIFGCSWWIQPDDHYVFSFLWASSTLLNIFEVHCFAWDCIWRQLQPTRGPNGLKFSIVVDDSAAFAWFWLRFCQLYSGLPKIWEGKISNWWHRAYEMCINYRRFDAWYLQLVWLLATLARLRHVWVTTEHASKRHLLQVEVVPLDRYLGLIHSRAMKTGGLRTNARLDRIVIWSSTVVNGWGPTSGCLRSGKV